jgi:hypothetical protein
LGGGVDGEGAGETDGLGEAGEEGRGDGEGVDFGEFVRRKTEDGEGLGEAGVVGAEREADDAWGTEVGLKPAASEAGAELGGAALEAGVDVKE